MYYLSKITPFFFVKAFVFLGLSLFLRHSQDWALFVMLLIYGFVAPMLVGAMYQIVPNSQNRRLFLPQLSYLTFFLNIIALLLFLMSQKLLGSVFLLFSYILFSVSILPTVKNRQPITVKFLLSSWFFLILSALFLLLSQVGIVPFQLVVHSLTIGSLLNAVYGVELAWIPMLTMTTLNFKDALRFFYAKQFSTLLMLLSFYITTINLLAFASLVEFALSLLFLLQIYRLLRQRRVKVPLPIVVKFFLFGMGLLPFGLLVGVVMSFERALTPFLVGIHYGLLIYGFAVFTVFGGVAHLLPRILYTWRFSGVQGVSISDLVDELAFPTFFKFSIVFYLLFLLFSLLPHPASLVSSVIYLILLLYFAKLTFLKGLSAFLSLGRYYN